MGLLLLTILAIQPPFTHSVSPVTRADLPYSWRGDALWGRRSSAAAARELLGLRRPGAHRDADRAPSSVRDLTKVFRPALSGRVPDPAHASVDVYRANDDRSMAADNTSGLQLPLRSRERPLVDARVRKGDRRQPGREPVPPDRRVPPPAGRAYLTPRTTRPGMAVTGGPRARVRLGRLQWGGRWTGRTTSTSRSRVLPEMAVEGGVLVEPSRPSAGSGAAGGAEHPRLTSTSQTTGS